jgi:hypothetical protein
VLYHSAQGTLDEGEGRFSTVDLLVKKTCFVEKTTFLVLKAPDQY